MKDQEDPSGVEGGGSKYNVASPVPCSNAHANPSDEFYFDTFPPGYRFKPYDEELVVHYLKKKIMNIPLPPNRINEVELYKFNPQTLAETWKAHGEKEWYFFTPRDRKYKHGERPNRAAGDGYWKATGADRPVRYNGAEVGSRKALVFYKGKPPRGDKTDWIMHEFRVDNPPKRKRKENDMRLDDWVLCRLYKKVDKSSRCASDNAVPDEEPDDEIPPEIHDRRHISIEDSKVLPRENFMTEGVEFFDVYGGYYNPPNQMGLDAFDNSATYIQGSQSSFSGFPQSYYPQLGQTSAMPQRVIPGYQNRNLMVQEPFPPVESHIKHEQFNEYHTDGLDQIVSSFWGPYNSVVPPSFNDDIKHKGKDLDQIVSNFKGPSNSVVPPSINDDKKRKEHA